MKNLSTQIRLSLVLALVCVLPALIPVAVLAKGAVLSASQGGVYWQVTAPNDGVSLRVIFPDGSAFEQNYSSGQAPMFRPQSGILPDGAYTWELVMSPVISAEMRARARAAREAGESVALPSGSVESGAFHVVGGVLKLPDPSAVEPQSSSSRQNNPAVPQDTFGTVEISADNTFVTFTDTSTLTGFPTRDWRLRANDTFSGGVDRFSIEDIDSGLTPFTVRGAAPANSLFVASSGNVGLGTGAPVVELQITDGDTPIVRLEQDNSGGFAPQTWDMAGNEGQFFIRDVTNGSKTPFRIHPNAPSSSIDIAASGNVGFGTGSPSDGDGLAEKFIDVKSGAAEDARVVVDSGDGAGRFGEFLFQRNDANKWSFGNENSRFYFYNYIPGAGAGYVMTIANATSNVTIYKDLTVNGTISNPSSREIKNLLAGVDGASVLAKLSSLPLFTWSYKYDAGVRHFGPVAEDFYERFSLGLDDKHISPNDLAGVALAATQALNKLVSEKDAEIRELKERLQRLESRMGVAPQTEAAQTTSQ